MRWNDETELRIGKFCSIAKGVKIILGGEHDVGSVTTYPLQLLFPKNPEAVNEPSTKGEINIGNDVWIGTGVTILSGVSIGDGAVIGAQSLVTKSVEPYTIAGGNPLRMIRKRFPDSTIRALLEVKWWDWPTEQIEMAAPLLLCGSPEKFLKKFYHG